MKIKPFSLTAALFGAATAALCAAETQTTYQFPDSLRTVEIQEVQVRSTRASARTPIAYSDMTREEIGRVNLGRDIPYLLSLTPAVTVTSDAGNGVGYTSLRIRGVDPSRINITANGIPMNDAESAQLFWVNMADFASSVQSMQVQRGAGTSTNGAGAFGATLNMQTENIGMTPFIGMDFSGGSYGTHKETLRFGTGLLGGRFGLQGRLSDIGSDGYLERASARLNSYFLQAGYFTDNTVLKFITFNGIEQTYHAWNYTSKFEQSLYGRRYNSCGEYYDAAGNVHYYDNQTDNYHQQNYQLILNQLLPGHLSLNAALHYTKGEGYYEEYKTNRRWAEYGLATDPAVKGDLVRRKKMDNDFYGLVAALNYRDDESIEATLGGGLNRYDGDHFGQVVWAGVPNSMTTVVELFPDFEYYRNNAVKNDANIYGKINYTLWQRLSAYIDLQYRYVGIEMQDPGDWFGANADGSIVIDEDYRFFNPKFGVNYSLDGRHRLFASYAVAHKEPTRNDFEDNVGTRLKPERLNDLEAGYRFTGTGFSAGVNFYWMDYRDQFVLTGELNAIGEPIARNVGESYRIGAELEAAWQPLSWLRWEANATLSKNRALDWTVTLDDGTTETLGNTPLSFSPDLIANNILTFSQGHFSAAVQSQFVGRQYLTNTGFKYYQTQDDSGNPVNVDMTLKEHFTTNLDFSYRFNLSSIGLKEAVTGVMLYNIFNASYDNNGWAAPSFKKEGGKVVAYTDHDQYEAGFAPSAPFNFITHLSLTF